LLNPKNKILRKPETNLVEVICGRALRENPFAGEKLSGSLHFLYSLHFSSGGVQYRSVYTIKEREKQIIIHYVGSRENFYEKVKRLFR